MNFCSHEIIFRSTKVRTTRCVGLDLGWYCNVAQLILCDKSLVMITVSEVLVMYLLIV